MNTLAHLVLLAWIPAIVVLFAASKPRHAVIVTLMAGTMFLPVLVLDLPGPVDFGKAEAISFALLIGVGVFDPSRLLAFRPRSIDLFLLAWLLSGPISSLTNDLGPYDAFAVLLTRIVKCGIPYWIGACYFTSREGLGDLLRGLFLAGLVYVPFCLFEVRFSPQLHRMLYGAAQHAFDQTLRGGGYRPMVFMAHGLELSLWMAAAMIAGIVWWRHLEPARLPFPLGPAVAVVALTLLLCKSTGALLLAGVGVVLTLPVTPALSRAMFLFCVPTYLLLRLFGSGMVEDTLLDFAEGISADRAGSLYVRLYNEAVLLDHLWVNPWFGAGGWYFASVADPTTGEPIGVVTDSYWIIAAATDGLMGLAGAVGYLWAPALRALGVTRALPIAGAGEIVGAAVVLSLLVADTMANAFVPPLYIALAGSLGRVARRGRPAVRRQSEVLTQAAPPRTGGRLAARVPVRPRPARSRQ